MDTFGLGALSALRKGAEMTDTVGMNLCVCVYRAVHMSRCRAGSASRLKITLKILGFHPAQVKSV